MQNTDNFDLKIYEGEDLFNPLVVENANAQAIDTQMKKNENHTVGDATELISGTVHALTRLTPDTPMLRFTATSRFTAGDTFTVDGVQVSALTVSGEQLPDGAYIIGSEVLAYLKGTLLTFFTSQGTLATAQNALKLGGNAPEYYATATAVETAQNIATAAGNLANEINRNLEVNELYSNNDIQIAKYGNIIEFQFQGLKQSELSIINQYIPLKQNGNAIVFHWSGTIYSICRLLYHKTTGWTVLNQNGETMSTFNIFGSILFIVED